MDQLTLVNGSWVCDPSKCPRRMPEKEDSVYRVEKRYLNIARIMFLSSGAKGQDPDEFAADVAAKIEELTEEIVDFDIEVYALEGGHWSCHRGYEPVTKRASKHTFRRQIFEYWNRKCAYCGEHADTLDHVIPRHKGGLTVRNNLVIAVGVAMARKVLMMSGNGMKSNRSFVKIGQANPRLDGSVVLRINLRLP